ncbi:HD-GYP domain-containing protein (plasmid) [Deinococcus sp. D7000]|nr:HD-GYP domain-containing protein [Deinococcus sp. D7000]
MALLAVAVARQLGLPAAQVREVYLAGLVHDLGKLFMPHQVRRKPTALTAHEWGQMQRHPVYSARLIRLLPGLSRTVRRAARHHHERWDGTGYPAGLSGETIPLLARILAVCDVYDALSSPRSYKRAWEPGAVERELKAQTGSHFDPQIVTALGEVLRWPFHPGSKT